MDHLRVAFPSVDNRFNLECMCAGLATFSSARNGGHRQDRSLGIEDRVFVGSQNALANAAVGRLTKSSEQNDKVLSLVVTWLSKLSMEVSARHVRSLARSANSSWASLVGLCVYLGSLRSTPSPVILGTGAFQVLILTSRTIVQAGLDPEV